MKLTTFCKDALMIPGSASYEEFDPDVATASYVFELVDADETTSQGGPIGEQELRLKVYCIATTIDEAAAMQDEFVTHFKEDITWPVELFDSRNQSRGMLEYFKLGNLESADYVVEADRYIAVVHLHSGWVSGVL